MPRHARSGWIRGVMTFPSVSNSATNPHFNSTGAVTLINTFTPGFQCVLEALGFVASITAAASAGSQVFKLRKGGTSGTVIATLTLAYTDIDALGDVKEVAVSSAAAIGDLTLTDTEDLSLTRDASGTDYTTKPEGHFYIRYRQLPQQQ